MKSNISANKELDVVNPPTDDPPNAVVSIPHINDNTTKSNADIIPPISIPRKSFPTNCRPVRLLGALKFESAMMNNE